MLWAKRILAPGLFVFSILGCSSTQYKKPSKDFPHIGKAIIITKDESAIVVNNPRIIGASIIAERDSNKNELAIPLADVQKVITSNSGKGALQGMGLGFLVGASGGFVVASMAYGSTKNCEEDCTDDGFEDQAIITSAVYLGPVIGAVAGTIIGAIVGSKVEYVFREPPLDTVLKQPTLFRQGKNPGGPNSW
jgi:hypothetical protein